MLEIVNEEKPNGVNALIKLFNDSELYTKWGSYAGRTNQTRLIWVLNVTRGSGQGGGPEYIPGIKWKNLPKELIDDLLVCGMAPLQLGIDFGGDNGFSSEFQDQKFYQDSDRWNSPGHLSTQVQHFLTAVAQSFPFSSINHLGQNLGLRAIIGHEKIDDRTNSEWAQIQSTKDSDIDHWFNAIEADKIGDKAQRDSELWAILNFGSEIAFGDVDPNRFGNSLQDLRLSLKGHRFYTWIQQHKSGSPNQAASWLAQTLTGR